jgi:hypothetical protein
MADLTYELADEMVRLPRMSNTEYKHFDTIEGCENYIRNNPHLNLSNKCCGGKGIGIKLNIKKDPIKRVTQTVSKGPLIKGTCDICFQDDVELQKTCKTCVQPICQSCLDKIISKVCPYCRGILS